MKKFVSLLLTVALLATMVSAFAMTASAETEHKWKCGTGEDYLYHICETCNEKEAHTLDSEGKCTCGYDSKFLIINNVREFNTFATKASKEDYSGKTVLLMTDITTNAHILNFNGIFDGCGHTINISRNSLFSNINGATVKNLTVSGNIKDAGFAVFSVNTAFINCTNLCTLNDCVNVSGLTNSANNCSFINCINRGDIYSSNFDAAGFSANIDGKTKFVNCASIGKSEGNKAFGIGNVFYGANVTLSNIYIGGSINGSNEKYLLTYNKNTFAENIYASTDLEGVYIEEDVTPTYTSDIGDVLTMLNTEAAKHEDWNSWVLDENGKLMIAPYKYHPAVEPTDTEAGSLPYYEANGKYYSDSDLTQEITDINAWLGVGGAGYVEPTETATDSAEGSTLSEGNLTIIVGVAAAVVFGLGGFFLGTKKKKKTAVAGAAESDE